jgi:hypothetical protein
VRLVADLAGLRVAIIDNVAYLTTPENARDMQTEQDKRQLHGNPAGGLVPRPLPSGFISLISLIKRFSSMNGLRSVRWLLGIVVMLSGVVLIRAEPQPPDLAVKLREVVSFPGIEADPKLRLSDVLDKLSQQFGLVFEVDETAFKADMVEDVMSAPIVETPLSKMKDVRLETVLRKVLSRVPSTKGAVYRVRRDAIEITTWDVLREAVWGLDYDGPYLPLVHARFDGQALTDALRELAEQSDFNVVIDARAADKARAATVTARLTNTPLDTAVSLLADMADLEPVLTDNLLYVTTKENAARLKEQKKRQKDNDPNGAGRVGSGRGVRARPPAMQ